MGNDSDSVDDTAGERKHERTERVENILASVREDLGTQQYPVSSEELATRYADRPMDLPNESESLGSVFDRLQGEYENEEAAYEAVATEIDRGANLGERSSSASDGPPYREGEVTTEEELADSESVDNEYYDSTPEQAQTRASEAQAEDHEETDADERKNTE